ncbi:ATP-binding protein [Limnobacter sp.]|uniref:ATP-binding protein n=1 Tax=Limnobacter sp. TaxID=2003368 RepID=UPI002FE0251F
MTLSSFPVLAILLGIALYPFFANHLPNQRQNASAVIGVVLMGFLVLSHETITEIAHGTPQHAALLMLSFLFFGNGFLGRKRGDITAEGSALLPFGMGVFLAAADILATSLIAQMLLITVQLACLLAITRTYNNLPKVTLLKAAYFSLMYCAVNVLIHFKTTAPNAWQPDQSVIIISYYVLLGTCLFHMCFQDFSRTRTKKGWDEQTKVDQDLMKLAFRGRRVLKDFRHDLRQPLSTLGILASVGKAISKDPEVTARYQHIQTAQKALKNMLEEFFDQLGSAIRYPVEENTAQLQKISIDEVLNPLIEEYRMLADVKELQIRYVPSNLTVLSNKEALSKIIRNGLDNAIKYTSKGGVVVGLRRRNSRICLQIADTGSGVENNKVAAHNKGWGHGSNIVRDLSEQIQAKTECRNRYYNGNLAGSVFEVILPGEGEVSHHWKLPSNAIQSTFEAQVMAMNHEHLLDIQRCLPVKGFDKVDFNLNGAYRAYLSALRKGMSPVYIMYAGEAGHKEIASKQLKLLGSMLDYEPCCILIYNASEESNPQVEFSREMIRIPMNPNQADHSLHIISELFPCRDTVPSINQSSVGQAQSVSNMHAKSPILST